MRVNNANQRVNEAAEFAMRRDSAADAAQAQLADAQQQWLRDSFALVIAGKDSVNAYERKLREQAQAFTATVERIATGNTEQVFALGNRLVDVAEKWPDANRPQNVTFKVHVEPQTQDTTVTVVLPTTGG